MWPQSVLMVSPDFFDVQYQINPHMVDKDGNLNSVDKGRAMQQWLHLRTVFENLSMDIFVIDGAQDLPDMVFCANQTFPFIKDGVKSVILSQMHSEKRQPEVETFRIWAKSLGWKVYDIDSGPFEGMGDALWNYETKEIFGGHGFRTSPEVYTQISEITGAPVVPLELKDHRFYHLDTCLSILGADVAAYVPEAFTSQGLATLKEKFQRLIEIPLDEAEGALAGNCCTPNGKDVIIQAGAEVSIARLEAAGFRVAQVDTREYIKSGGSVFCMKQLLF